MRQSTLLVILLCTFITHTASAQPRKQVSLFPLNEVELLESPFLKAQQADLRYILDLEADRLLAPFLREAGLTPKAPSYTNWENTGLDGHIGGHYLSALSMMYAATGDKVVKERLDYMISELHRAQEAVGTGFIGGTPGSLPMWAEIKAGNIRAGGFSLNDKWVPLYNIHKTYAGLRDAYLHAGSELAKQMLIELTDWMIDITAGLTDDQMQDMLRSEHGGLNETFADVFAITGDSKYLTLARRFSHQIILEPLLKDEDQLTGMHANTQIPKVIGFKRIADLDQDAAWDRASDFFWHTVTEHRSVCMGGNSVREHFHPANNFTPMLTDREGPETCNTYNMLRLAEMLYQTSTNTHYMDYCERALYNHILSTEEPDRGGFVYFTSMRSGHYRVYSQPQTSFWCCVGSGLENHTKYGEFIYAHSDNALYVNLFVPSRLSWKEQGITLRQETRFPDNGLVTLTIEQASKKSTALNVRYPAWAEGMKLAINGKAYSFNAQAGGYVTIDRKWKKGDVVTIDLPMQVRLEQIPDKQDYYAFMYGPIVLAAVTGTDHLDGLYADDSRGGHIAHGKLMPMQDNSILVGDTESIRSSLTRQSGDALSFIYKGGIHPDTDKPLELIPFFRLHNARYAVYFRQADEQQLKAIVEETERIEQQAMELAQRTVDLIFCGEQQPESDHNIKFEDSRTGIQNDLHYRRATGWFSYNLKVKEGFATQLMLTMQKNNKAQTTITLNGQPLTGNPVIADVSGSEESLVTATYTLPEALQPGTYTVRFAPADGQRSTADIYEVRLIK